MYLKRLEINGFKSFAQKTVLDFLPECEVGEDASSRRCGITAIVGPNGSGKSNVADAIRWAIGEQSAKQLRGKKSEDVIFAGSSTKARLGQASVSLSFDNHDQRIPLEFNEVTVTRRLYRSGESEYLINGARARLMDVVDLLAKAGIGKDSHCVITQGMSDSVLHATPLERRAIIEEAAGVKPYQIEKERSLRKLESTRENLAQVRLLVREIEPHLKNLKRQAERASQARELADTLRRKQMTLYGLEWRAFEGERQTAREALGVLEREVSELEKRSAELEEAFSREAERVEDQSLERTIESELARLRDEDNQALRELTLTEGRLEMEREKRAPREIIESIPVDLQYVRERLSEVREAQATLIERLTVVEDLSELQELRELARVIETRLHELHEDAGQGTKVTKRTVTLEGEALAESDRRLRELEAAEAKHRATLETTQSKISEQAGALEAARAAAKAARENFFRLEHEARTAQSTLNTLKDRLNETRVTLARAEVHEEDLRRLVSEELHSRPEELIVDGEFSSLSKERLEKDVLRLKVQLEEVGGIDPLVTQEYTETEERYAFLTQESADLEQACLSLEKVVAEMDQKISSAFESAFDSINRHFEKYFKLIFNGGRAELSRVNIRSRARSKEEGLGEGEEEGLEPEEGLVQVGVDITACPPGKKIASLSMLSGGERSLTSLALLFAIIAHNPPPFAVLDEVEAALDEANSRRFSRLLQEFSGRTQFVAITHNRETMREASLLYGVTMGEDGVSKILSVRLDQIGQGGKVTASV